MSELRRHPRREVRVEFVCKDESGLGQLIFDSADVSAGGAFLVSDVLFEQGETLSIDFTLPGGVALHTVARIAWVRRFPAEGQEAGMGIEFLGLGGIERRALDAYLKGP